MGDNWGKILGGAMMGLFAIMMVLVFANTIEAATPQPQYVCPICGEKFASLADLENHFATAHPGTPITVTWS
jgi:hypothetical protein